MGTIQTISNLFRLSCLLLCIHHFSSANLVLVFNDCSLEAQSFYCSVSFIDENKTNFTFINIEEEKNILSDINGPTKIYIKKNHIYKQKVFNDTNKSFFYTERINHDTLFNDIDHDINYNNFINDINNFIKRVCVAILQNFNWFYICIVVCLAANQRFLAVLLFGIFILTSPVQAVKFESCSTLGIGVSNITDCIGSTCTARFSTEGVGYLDDNYKTCIVLNEIKSGDNVTIIPTHNVTVQSLDASFKVPLTLKKVGAEISYTWNAYCENAIAFNNQEKCDRAVLQGNYSFTFCSIIRMYKRDGIPGHRDVAIKVGVYAKPRYFHYKIETDPITDIVMTHEYDNFTDAKLWNGISPLEFNLNNKIKLNVFNAKFDNTPNLGSNIVIDSWAPYDAYTIENINNVGEHKPELLDAVHFDVNGVLRFNLETFRTIFSYKMIKCDDYNTRVQVTANYADSDVTLENKRKSKEGLAHRYNGLRFYNEGAFRMNDEFSNAPEFTHVHMTTAPKADYSKLGPMNILKQVTALTTSGIPVNLALTNEMKCVYSFDEDSWQAMEITMLLKGCYGQNIYTYCAIALGQWWVRNGTAGNYAPWSNDTSITYCLVNERGDNINWNWNDLTNISATYRSSNSHLYIPFQNTGSYQYTLKAEYTGSFFSSQVCPDIQKVLDDPINRKIYIFAKSTCGNGPAIITTSSNQLLHSKAISLTAAYQNFTVDRIANVTGLVTVGLCGTDCFYKDIKAKPFPTVNPDDETEDADGNLGNTISDYINSDDWWDFGNLINNFAKLSPWHKFLAILYFLGIGIAAIIGLIILVVILREIIACWEGRELSLIHI